MRLSGLGGGEGESLAVDCGFGRVGGGGGGGSCGSGRAWWWWFLILGCSTKVVAVGCGGRGGWRWPSPVAAVIEFGAFEGST